MQTAVLAAVSLRKRIESLDDIASIEIDTTHVGYQFLAKDRAKWRPATRETADHSLPYTVARALIDGTITRATYDAADLGDPQVLSLIDRISVKEDAALTAQMPSLGNRVTIRLNDGTVLSDEHGTRKNPRINIPDETFEDKYRGFALGRFSEAEIRRTLDACWQLEGPSSVTQILSSLQPGLRSPTLHEARGESVISRT
jgi:2-methylcitrate dehydratase